MAVSLNLDCLLNWQWQTCPWPLGKLPHPFVFRISVSVFLLQMLSFVCFLICVLIQTCSWMCVWIFTAHLIDNDGRVTDLWSPESGPSSKKSSYFILSKHFDIYALKVYAAAQRVHNHQRKPLVMNCTRCAKQEFSSLYFYTYTALHNIGKVRFNFLFL